MYVNKKFPYFVKQIRKTIKSVDSWVMILLMVQKRKEKYFSMSKGHQEYAFFLDS